MRAVVDCGEMDLGDVREETVVGNACGGKPGSHGSRGVIPTLGQLSESEEKHLRLRVKQLVYGSLNGMRIRQSLL